MWGKLKTLATYLLNPPWAPEGPHPLTLAIPDASSSFKNSDVGWARRPPAVLRCPTCESDVDHRYATDMIRCETCRFEQSPERIGELEVLELSCPECRSTLDHGIRHPNVFDFPQWAACPDCQYHWEFQHSFASATA